MSGQSTVFHGPLGVLFAPGVAPELADVLAPAAASLPVAAATDRAVWDAGSGSADRATIRDLLARAEADIGQPWPQPLASGASRVHRDGDRDGWEQAAFARQRRVSRAAVAAAVTLDERWLDEVADGVWLLCEQSSWCWPAHDDSFRTAGSVLADVESPFLDLGAGEVVGQLAWIDHLLGAQLDLRYPGIRTRIRRETRLRIIEPFLRRRDWHWLGLDGRVHNWNPWIHGNVLVAALRLLDGPENADLRLEVVRLVVEGLDRFVDALPDDGAVDEGYSYWWNGACRALEALDILAFATGGKWDAAASVPALRATVAFPHRMHLGGPWYVNAADGQSRPDPEHPWHSLHRAAIQVADDAARAHAASHRRIGAPLATEREGLGRLLRGLTDPAWLSAVPAPSPLPRDVWLPSTQTLVARARAGECTGLALAVKGGHNDESHNHNDVGSFIVASDGVPVLVDAGRPTYTAATFGPDRYEIWTMQSGWHSVPVIRGVEQHPGSDAAARDVTPIIADERSGLSLELAAAYDAPGLRSWRRTATLIRNPRGLPRVELDDEWELDPWIDGDEPATTIRLLIAGRVALRGGGATIVPLEGAPRVRLTWSPPVPASLVGRPLEDPMLSEVWGERLTRLDLVVTDQRALDLAIELDEPDDKDAT